MEKTLRKISKEELEEILKKHQDWLKDGSGKMADLSYTDLSSVCYNTEKNNLKDNDV